jgi:hypothetical protein
MDEEERIAFDLWLEGRPPIIQKMAKLCPPNCYRGERRGHYRLYSYNENGTVTLLHGKDSFLPGIVVFGVDPATLVACGCGKWDEATEAQAEATARRIDRERGQRGPN